MEPAGSVADLNDIAAAVDKFTHAPTALRWGWGDVALTTPGGVLDFLGIDCVVEALPSIAYPFAGPRQWRP
jgi:hypothetical protein